MLSTIGSREDYNTNPQAHRARVSGKYADHTSKPCEVTQGRRQWRKRRAKRYTNAV